MYFYTCEKYAHFNAFYFRFERLQQLWSRLFPRSPHTVDVSKYTARPNKTRQFRREKASAVWIGHKYFTYWPLCGEDQLKHVPVGDAISSRHPTLIAPSCISSQFSIITTCVKAGASEGFSCRVVEPWNSLPAESCHFLSPSTLKLFLKNVDLIIWWRLVSYLLKYLVEYALLSKKVQFYPRNLCGYWTDLNQMSTRRSYNYRKIFSVESVIFLSVLKRLPAEWR